MLEVRLLGTFDIKCDGKPVNISSRIAQSLLAYLVLHAGTSYRREKLAGMFWPDAPEDKARAYLRHELWRLRKAIPSTELLLADDIGIAFNSSTDYCLDSEVLEKLKDTSSVEELMVGLSAYTGELLPGFYDEWIVVEREHLQSVFEQKITRLLELLESEKRWSEILKWAELWIISGQGPEDAYRYLMIAYEAQGDHVRVTSTYERCKKALRALDLEPSEQTRALAFKRASKLNIPIPLTSFIGREKELEEVAGLLSKCRLVTLTGSGGVGKTRLAIQVIADVLELYPDGVWFLDLAPLGDQALVPNTLANVLGLREPADPKLSVTDLLKGYLRSRTALIIFDNCEHLIESCAQLVNSLLNSCENLTIFVTSREALRVSGEIPYRVPSLEVPQMNISSASDAVMEIESVQLFTERATFTAPGFAIGSQNTLVIAQICQRLEGIPLAIELAAARANMLTVEQIVERLDDRFKLLTGGLRTALPRHQTLRATIEWSYSLLSIQERLLFRRLAVFMGGWTLESAEEVCSGNSIEPSNVLDLLSQLVNKSLVVIETAERETRFRSLETIRQYARERLIESGEQENTRTRHLKYFLQFSDQAELGLRGPAQIEWYARLINERDNIRATLEWANHTDVEAGLYVSGRLHRFWENFDVSEGARWLAGFLQKSESKRYPLARAKALCIQARIMFSAQDLKLGYAEAQESLDLYKSCGDKPGEIDALLALGLTATDAPIEKAMKLYKQALTLSETLGDQWRQAYALTHMGWPRNNYQRSISTFERAVRIFEIVGDLESSTGNMLDLVMLHLINGNLQLAQKWLDEVAKMSQNLNNKGLQANILHHSGCIALARGDYERARTDLLKALVMAQALGHRAGFLWTDVRLGYVALREGNLAEAGNIFTETALNFQKDQNPDGVAFTLEGMASLHITLGKADLAARLIGWADATREKIHDSRPLLEQADVDRDIAAIIAKIGNTAFEEAYKAGRIMPLEEAVDYAIEEL